jgi:hypothetical protein
MQRKTVVNLKNSLQIIPEDAYAAHHGADEVDAQQGTYPVQPMRGRNIMPTREGYQSHFGLEAIGPRYPQPIRFPGPLPIVYKTLVIEAADGTNLNVSMSMHGISITGNNETDMTLDEVTGKPVPVVSASSYTTFPFAPDSRDNRPGIYSAWSESMKSLITDGVVTAWESKPESSLSWNGVSGYDPSVGNNAALARLPSQITNETTVLRMLQGFMGTDTAGTAQWTWCTVKGELYLYRAGYPYACRLQRTSSAPGGIRIDILRINFLSMGNQRGIFSASGSLGFWDGTNAVATSSALDPIDFVPDAKTLANVSTSRHVKGAIINIAAFDKGYIIYATGSIVEIREEKNSLLRWSSKPVLSGSGITDYLHVAVSQPNSTHFAWTSTGLYALHFDKEPQVLVPDVYDMLNRFGVKLALAGGRYLFLQYASNVPMFYYDGWYELVPPSELYVPGYTVPGVSIPGVFIPGDTVCYRPDQLIVESQLIQGEPGYPGDPGDPGDPDWMPADRPDGYDPYDGEAEGYWGIADHLIVPFLTGYFDPTYSTPIWNGSTITHGGTYNMPALRAAYAGMSPAQEFTTAPPATIQTNDPNAFVTTMYNDLLSKLVGEHSRLRAAWIAARDEYNAWTASYPAGIVSQGIVPGSSPAFSVATVSDVTVDERAGEVTYYIFNTPLVAQVHAALWTISQTPSAWLASYDDKLQTVQKYRNATPAELGVAGYGSQYSISGDTIVSCNGIAVAYKNGEELYSVPGGEGISYQGPLSGMGGSHSPSAPSGWGPMNYNAPNLSGLSGTLAVAGYNKIDPPAPPFSFVNDRFYVTAGTLVGPSPNHTVYTLYYSFGSLFIGNVLGETVTRIKANTEVFGGAPVQAMVSMIGSKDWWYSDAGNREKLISDYQDSLLVGARKAIDNPGFGANITETTAVVDAAWANRYWVLGHKFKGLDDTPPWPLDEDGNPITSPRPGEEGYLGTPDSIEWISYFVPGQEEFCGVTNDINIPGISIPPVQVPDLYESIPGYLIDTKSRGISMYSKLTGAYVFDLHLQKWGMMDRMKDTYSTDSHTEKDDPESVEDTNLKLGFDGCIVDFRPVNGELHETSIVGANPLNCGVWENRVLYRFTEFNDPRYSLITYGNHGFRGDMDTSLEQVVVNTVGPGNYWTMANTSLSGASLTYGMSGLTLSDPVSTQTVLNYGKIGKWHRVTVQGHFNLRELILKSHKAGRR